LNSVDTYSEEYIINDEIFKITYKIKDDGLPLVEQLKDIIWIT